MVTGGEVMWYQPRMYFAQARVLVVGRIAQIDLASRPEISAEAAG